VEAPERTSIAGRVLLDGQPVNYYGVTATRNFAFSAVWGPAKAIHAADGRFRVPVSEAGTWDLVIAGPRFARRVLTSNAVEDGHTLDVGDVVVNRGHTIRGVVRDAGGPVAGADVSFVTTPSIDGGELDELARGNLSAASDGSGAYEIEGVVKLPLETFHPQIMAATRDHRVSWPVAAPDADATIDLAVAPAGTVEITVTGSVQTAVFVRPAGNSRISLPARRSGGVFRLDVPAGDYEVVAFQTGAQPPAPRQQVSVITGAVALVTFAITSRPPVAIEVRVAGASCDEVELEAPGDLPVATAKCSDGVAHFAQVEPGLYKACGTSSGVRTCMGFRVSDSPNQKFEIRPRQQP
jgi:hypothetical protein